MKKLSVVSLCIVFLLLLSGAAAVAQTVVLEQSFTGSPALPKAIGTWAVRNGRLHQTDVNERLARITVPAPQSGMMQYEFDVRYEAGGFEDMMGGFGIQIFVDKTSDKRSWGDGDSYLLWLNFDPKATYGGTGFRAQVYRSYSATKMELVKGLDFDLNHFAGLLTPANVSTIVKARIKVDTETGYVWVEDPTLPGYGYMFYLDAAPKAGNYIGLRTNSLSVSFDNLKVTKLR